MSIEAPGTAGETPRAGPAQPLTPQLLRAQHGLAHPGHDADKERRGQVLVVAGSREIPGAALLAATAALRAGAGKLTIATAQSVALAVAVAMPEARVIALPEDDRGGFAPAGLDLLAPLAGRTAALLIGPGLADEGASCRFAVGLLQRFAETPVVLDAAAMGAVTVQKGGSAAPPSQVGVVVTPHAGELAHLTGWAKEEIAADPVQFARRAAAEWGVVVALKGSATAIAHPDGRSWLHENPTVGLATSGSGDVLAGIAAGLAARGTDVLAASLWSVVLHAHAGQRLARAMGTLGYLAREIAAEIPAVLHALSADEPPLPVA